MNVNVAGAIHSGIVPRMEGAAERVSQPRLMAEETLIEGIEENPRQGPVAAALLGTAGAFCGAFVGGGAGIYGAYKLGEHLINIGSDPALAVIAGLVSGVILTPIGAKLGAVIFGLIGAGIGWVIPERG